MKLDRRILTLLTLSYFFAGCNAQNAPLMPSSTSRAVSAAASPSIGRSLQIREFPIPTASAAPGNLANGPHDVRWVLEFYANKVAAVRENGAVTEYPVPSPAQGNPHVITAAPDGNLWFSEDNTAAGGQSYIGRVTTSGFITMFPIPTLNSRVVGVAVGPDKNIWFCEPNAQQIGEITSAGQITEYPVPNSSGVPWAITTGPDGNIWYTLLQANSIARRLPDGVTTEFPVPTPNALPNFITTGPDGNLWFVEFNGNSIGRITPAGVITEFPIPPNGGTRNPGQISLGPNGNLWFTIQQQQPGLGMVGKINPRTGEIKEYSVPSKDVGPGIVLGSDGNLWFTEWDADKVGRIDCDGHRRPDEQLDRGDSGC